MNKAKTLSRLKLVSHLNGLKVCAMQNIEIHGEDDEMLLLAEKGLSKLSAEVELWKAFWVLPIVGSGMFTVRMENAIVNYSDFKYMGDLIAADYVGIIKTPDLGKKAYDVLQDLLSKLDLNLGVTMDDTTNESYWELRNMVENEGPGIMMHEHWSVLRKILE